jgi:hypothetical protein
MMAQCRSEAAQKTNFDPLAWYLPDQRKAAQRRAEKKARDERERREILADPVKLAAYRAQRQAEWNAFMIAANAVQPGSRRRRI